MYRAELENLRPLDVGGAGDCFFSAVSHQLYGNPCHHLQLSQDKPRKFLITESDTHSSWDDYLVSMSLQGSWCDAIIVQAVAKSKNLRIHIVKSHENSSDATLIKPAHL